MCNCLPRLIKRKSLPTLFVFTWDKSTCILGKLKGKSISKSSERESIFENDCFLSSNSVKAICKILYIYVKARCKKGEMWKATCSFSAGKGDYWNHLMAFSLNMPNIFLTYLLRYSRKELPVQVLLEGGEALGTRRLLKKLS